MFVSQGLHNQMPQGTRQQKDMSEAGWELNQGRVGTGKPEPMSWLEDEPSVGLVRAEHEGCCQGQFVSRDVRS